MTFSVVSEIRLARNSLPKLSALERRRLLRRIIEALDALQDAPIPASGGLDWSSIDTIILSTSQALGEIAAMPDDDFGRVINEFDTLFAKLSDRLLNEIEPSSLERH